MYIHINKYTKRVYSHLHLCDELIHKELEESEERNMYNSKHIQIKKIHTMVYEYFSCLPPESFPLVVVGLCGDIN